MPESPGVPQKVKPFTARNTFIAESSIEDMSAIGFDAVIMRLFGGMPDIDRSKWDMADRLFAMNSALAQTADRQVNGLPYIRLDEVQKGQFQLSLIEPVEPDEAEEPAIESATNELPESPSDEPDKLRITLDLLRHNPNATDLEIAVALGLKTNGVARMWKVKARSLLDAEQAT